MLPHRLAQGGAPQAAGMGPLIGFYFLIFAAIGVILPFVPAYLYSLALSATQVGVLLAIMPTFAILAPHGWAWLCDRSGRPDRVLSILAVGSTAFLFPLLFARSFWWLAAILCGYSLFSTAISTVIDSLALQRVAAVGGSYSRLRLFGSLGFVVASSCFGLAITEVDRFTIAVPLACLGAAAAWSFTVKARGIPTQATFRPWGAWSLIRSAGLGPFLLASCIHWIACAPWNGSLAIHLTALGLPPYVVGLSAGLGVLAEIAAMFLYPRFCERIAPRHLLFIAYAASAARWAGMALLTDATSIILLSVLHGLTFGAFFVASVAYVAKRVPASMRATGQALFVSITFGLGGLAGLVSAGIGYDLLGGAKLFAVAAVVELLAATLALGLRPPPALGEPGISGLAPSSER